MKEGEALLLSSSELRSIWESNKANLHNFIIGSTRQKSDVFRRDFAFSRSSVLLLGYSMEMFLKSGLLRVFAYCPEELVRAELRRFGHKFEDIAKRINFEIKKTDTHDFVLLSKSVLEDARYPVTPGYGRDYIQEVNRITGLVCDQAVYQRLERLVIRVQQYVAILDQDSSNAASFCSRKLEDGYFVARSGGHLPSMITYRSDNPLSNEELKHKITSKTTLVGGWDEYSVYEDYGFGSKRKCRRAFEGLS